MPYSRKNPSPRYLELLENYKKMHEEGDKTLNISAERMYEGLVMLQYLKDIKALIDKTGSSTLLDYGCGKAKGYERKIEIDNKFYTPCQYWNLSEVTFYDPGYPPYEQLPNGQFDGVISIDVFEHIPFEDMDWVLDEMFHFAKKFVFIALPCFSAKKTLPSGENAHCTVRSKEWWFNKILDIESKYPQITWKLTCLERETPNSGVKITNYIKTSKLS